MNKKILAAVVAAVMTVPAMAAASQFTATGEEQIVEGHTVFTVLEKEDVDVAAKRQGWDIAGLVREIDVQQYPAGPNVAWFNDQWKTFYPGAQDVIQYRYPCGGYVLGTPAGTDPTHVLGYGVVAGAALTLDGVVANLTYVESYYITDPNGFVSVTHLYKIISPLRIIPVWVTEVQGVNSVGDDDGLDSSNCAPIEDCPDSTFNAACTQNHPDHRGWDETPYWDGGNDAPVRLYNFDMFGLWRDVTTTGAKTHGNSSTSALAGEVSGCEAGTEWECPSVAGIQDDDMEGYSHPYNPDHGYDGELHTHETARIDLIFVSTLDRLPALAAAYPPAYPYYEVYDDEALESEIHACNPDRDGDGNADGTVNVDIAASCFPS